jgi:hypothetical protein
MEDPELVLLNTSGEELKKLNASKPEKREVVDK